MPYKKGKFKCSNCSAEVSRPETKRCRKCADKSRPKRISLEEKKAKRQKYKAEYFQKNKNKIQRRIARTRAANPEKTREQDFKRHLKSRFGITIETYDRLFATQRGRCAICTYSPPPNPRKTERLYVDHDHNDGEIRGLLCMNCNSGLGHFKESLTLLHKSLEYLERYKNGKSGHNSTSAECSKTSQC